MKDAFEYFNLSKFEIPEDTPPLPEAPEIVCNPPVQTPIVAAVAAPIVEVVAPVAPIVEVRVEARRRQASAPPTIQTSLPPGLLSQINEIIGDEDSQLEFEDADGFAFGDLAQLKTSATAYDDIAYRCDLVEWGEIRIGKGTTKVKLPWDELGIAEGAIDALKRADATQPAITLLREVEKAANELKGMRSRIQLLYMTRYGNKWVSIADRYGVVCIALAEMLDREAELRRFINELHGEAYRGYLIVLAEIMQATSSASSADIVREIRENYAHKFPTKAQMNRAFGIRIEKPRIRPALKRRLEGNLESAELMAQIAQANRTIEEEAAIARINRMNEQIVLEAKAKAVNSYSQKVLKKIAETLNRLQGDKVKPGNLTKTVKESVSRALEDLRIMTDEPWASSLQGAVEQVRAIDQLAQDEEVSAETLRDEIDTLLEAFSREYKFEFTSAVRGHRSALPDIDFGDED